jgi:hypothetical protein
MAKNQILWANEEIDILTEKYPNLSNRELSKILGRTVGSIKGKAIKLGLKKSYSINHNKLKILLDNSNKSNYWLGFIMSDGYISSGGELKISLNIKDIDHLSTFCNYVKANINVSTKHTVCFNYYKRGHICAMSCKDSIYGKLIREKFNIIDKKTYNPISIDYLAEKNAFISFLCGLIDGDGCFCKGSSGKFSFIRIQCHSSWFSVYQIICSRLLSYEILSKVSIDTQGYCRFIINKSNSILLYNIIKFLNIPYLSRKWNLLDI